MDLRQVFKPENSEYKRVHKKNPGLFEFLDSEYAISYDCVDSSLEDFTSFLKDIWINKTHQRNITMHTGEGGMKLFDKLIKGEYGK